MCRAVHYVHHGRERRVSFTDAAARLPVRTRTGGTRLVAWGRRRHQEGTLPLGGWARIEAVTAGRWDRWFPRPVQIPLLGFTEQDLEGRERSYELVRGQCLQGLLVCDDNRLLRVYVVTVEPEVEDAIHLRWPRVMRLEAETPPL
jgi:hypothetical protein